MKRFENSQIDKLKKTKETLHTMITQNIHSQAIEVRKLLTYEVNLQSSTKAMMEELNYEVKYQIQARPGRP